MALLEGVVEVMAEDVLGAIVSPPVLAIGAVLAAPVVAPRISRRLRPVTKQVVKGTLVVYDKGKELLTEMAEQFSDIVAESRSELAAAAATSGVAATAVETAVEQVESASEEVNPPQASKKKKG